MPTDIDELPKWADSLLDTFQNCFWDEMWREGGEAIATLEREMIEARYFYVKEGMILKSFQLFSLYKLKGFKTFKDYCVKGLKKTVYYAKKVIKAAQIAWNLLLEGFIELPDNVSQAERLSNSARQVSEEGDETANCWSKVLEMSKKEGKGLTANYIEKTITGEESKPMASTKLPRKDWEKLGKKAKKLGKSTQELLEEIVKDYLGEDSTEELEGDPPPGSRKSTYAR